MARLAQRLMEGNSPVVNLFKHNPFPDAPPTAIRVKLYLYRPTTLAEHKQSGQWWQRRYIGSHLAPMSLDPNVWDEWLNDPEQFHWDDIYWKQRSDRLNALITAAKGNADTTQLILAHSKGISAEDIACFWQIFVPSLSEQDRTSWESLPKTVQRLRESYSRIQLLQFERIVQQLSLILLARVEDYWQESGATRPEIESFFHLGMLFHHIIGKGQAAYEAVARNPALITQNTNEVTPQSGLFFWALFCHETLVYHARKFRVLEVLGALPYARGLPGFLALIPFLQGQFMDGDDTVLPSLARKIKDGTWFVVEN
jgi:hypothetical protein